MLCRVHSASLLVYCEHTHSIVYLRAYCNVLCEFYMVFYEPVDLTQCNVLFLLVVFWWRGARGVMADAPNK
jgi:hypothetical protein